MVININIIMNQIKICLQRIFSNISIRINRIMCNDNNFRLATSCNIGGILFVAPWLDLLDYAIEDEESYNTAKPWLTTKIDFEKIKKFTNNIHCIFSSDDYFVSLDQKYKFEELLNAKTIVVNNKGHISEDDNVFELKEILDECNEMIK